MKLNIKEVEAYIGKLDDFLSELNNLSWTGLESQVKEVTVTHFKSKVNSNFKNEIENREFPDQINQSIENVEKKIEEIVIEKYKVINAYRKYMYSNTVKQKIADEYVELNYDALKSLLRDLKNTQEQFYENILNVREEKRHGVRDGVYITNNGQKIDFEYDTMIEITPIYNNKYLDERNAALKNLIFELEAKIDEIYIKKEIELCPKYLTHKNIYELFK